MTYQGQPATHSARGQRFHQPSDTREPRKQPKPSDMILMPDGLHISPRIFKHLRSTAHQKFLGSHEGCAQAIRRAIPKSEWTVLSVWIDQHRPQFGHNSRQNDSLTATLVGYAAQKLQKSVPSIYAGILEGQSASVLLPAN